MSARPSPAAMQALADDAWLMDVGIGSDIGSSTGAPAGDEDTDRACNHRVHALAASVRAAAPAWLRDVVPGYASLGVFFDPRVVDAMVVRDWLLEAWQCLPADAPGHHGARTVEIPVLYGGEAGIDLERAAAELGLSAAALARRHAAGSYTVAMIGFAPGFPYLSGLDPALALPRLATPRTHVPAGSVAIGGAQTGVYPRDSPGGWRLLGRTPLVLFDPERELPSLLAAGDCVRFRAIDAATYARLTHAP